MAKKKNTLTAKPKETKQIDPLDNLDPTSVEAVMDSEPTGPDTSLQDVETSDTPETPLEGLADDLEPDPDQGPEPDEPAKPEKRSDVVVLVHSENKRRGLPSSVSNGIEFKLGKAVVPRDEALALVARNPVIFAIEN